MCLRNFKNTHSIYLIIIHEDYCLFVYEDVAIFYTLRIIMFILLQYQKTTHNKYST